MVVVVTAFSQSDSLATVSMSPMGMSDKRECVFFATHFPFSQARRACFLLGCLADLLVGAGGASATAVALLLFLVTRFCDC